MHEAVHDDDDDDDDAEPSTVRRKEYGLFAQMN